MVRTTGSDPSPQQNKTFSLPTGFTAGYPARMLGGPSPQNKDTVMQICALMAILVLALKETADPYSKINRSCRHPHVHYCITQLHYIVFGGKPKLLLWFGS